jgi:hypothetical protein
VLPVSSYYAQASPFAAKRIVPVKDIRSESNRPAFDRYFKPPNSMQPSTTDVKEKVC